MLAGNWGDTSLGCLSKTKAAVLKVLWFSACLYSECCSIQAEIMPHYLGDKGKEEERWERGLWDKPFAAGFRSVRPRIQTSRGLEKVSHLSGLEPVCLLLTLATSSPQMSRNDTRLQNLNPLVSQCFRTAYKQLGARCYSYSVIMVLLLSTSCTSTHCWERAGDLWRLWCNQYSNAVRSWKSVVSYF